MINESRGMRRGDLEMLLFLLLCNVKGEGASQAAAEGDMWRTLAGPAVVSSGTRRMHIELARK